MFVDDLIQEAREQEELQILNERCSQFILESEGNPLLKNLSTKYGDFYKVKVRTRKDSKEFDEIFNEAFAEDHHNLRQRAIFTNGLTSFEPCNEVLEPFFIFPIDGFKYMYNKEVEQSGPDYKQVFDLIFENFSPEKSMSVITELLRFTYRYDQLKEGIVSGSEIIMYNIPFYYAIRCSAVNDYNSLLTNIELMV